MLIGLGKTKSDLLVKTKDLRNKKIFLLEVPTYKS